MILNVEKTLKGPTNMNLSPALAEGEPLKSSCAQTQVTEPTSAF